MSDGFYKAILEELAEVKTELSKNALFIRYRKLNELRDIYAPSVKISENDADVSLPKTDLPPTPRIRIRVNPERQRIIDLSRDIIAISGDPVPTIDLLSHLANQGIQIAGEEPRNNLSAILSNSGIFDANGRKGWTLKQESREIMEFEAQDETDPDVFK